MPPPLVPKDKPDLSLLKGADCLGMVMTAIFLNRVEYTLGTGLRRDSFDDETLRTATWTSGVAGILSVLRDLACAHPAVAGLCSLIHVRHL